MAIKREPITGPGSTRYTPGSHAENSFPMIACVAAYDVLTITGFSFLEFVDGVSNVTPDADGYMPHLAIRPAPYLQVADPRSNAAAQIVDRFGIPASGNIKDFPPIRVDFGRVRVPWAANISIEGGSGSATKGTLLITYIRDRAPWHKDAIPTLSDSFNRNTLTLYNVARDTRIQRPANANTVFNPGGQDLTMDNGPSTYSAIAKMGAAAGGEPGRMGPFSYVRCPSSSVDSLIFGVTVS